MKRFLTLLMMIAAPLASQAELRVFACEPEWASLATELGGELVETTSATQALQDPHYIQARPSLISQVRRADLVICSGADLEIGWLPKLLQKANNASVRPGTLGYFEASSFVPRLEVPSNVDRATGDMHPQGNPHVQANPHNITLIATALSERLQTLDASNALVYQQRTDDFLNRWLAAIDQWEARGAVLKGHKIIVHHKSWVYLQDWLGLQETATLEPVPGVPPTASHLGELVSRFKDGGAEFIIRSPYQSDKASTWLSDRTGIPAVMLPLTVGGSERASDLFSLFEDTLDRLLQQP